MKKFFVLIFLFISVGFLFSAERSGSNEEYIRDLEREEPYETDGVVHHVRSYDVHTLQSLSVGIGVQALSVVLSGKSYENLEDRFAVLDTISPVMINLIWKQRSYIEWIIDPLDGKTDRKRLFTQVLGSSSVGFVFGYNGDSVDEYSIGAVIVPYQFSSADFSVGIGLQFLLDSDAKNDLLISLVVPFSYKVGGKTSN